MKERMRFIVYLLAFVMVLSGCATTRAKKPDEKAEMNSQIQAMQNELQAKDQQILDLQAQLDSAQNSLDNSGVYSSKKSAKGSSYIRVSGVTVTDVQKALERAGLDPGPVDGRLGKRTKSALKAFQRRNNLRADGIVGEKTWALLQ